MNIKKSFKKEAAHLKSIMPAGMKIEFYYKDRKMSEFNKTTAIMIDTLRASLSYKKPLRDKDFDLYNTVDVRAQSYSYPLKSRVVIGDKYLFGGDFKDSVSQQFWNHFLSHLASPADRFKFLFYHEAGHLIQVQQNTKFVLKGQDLSEQILPLLSPKMQSLIAEMYADCFALYMSSREQPDTLPALAALILEGRTKISNKELLSGAFNRLDIVPAILHFVHHLPQEHTLEAVDRACSEAMTYAIIKAIHFHSLSNENFRLDVVHHLTDADKFYNVKKSSQHHAIHHKLKDSGFHSLIVHELLHDSFTLDEADTYTSNFFSHMIEDMQCREYVQKNYNPSLSLTTDKFQRSMSVFDILMNILNSVYYTPRGKYTI